jgi:hypothetical protein
MKQSFDKKWATFFYEANIPFNVAHHSAFIDVVKSTSKGKILYKLLSYHSIRIDLLKSSKEDLLRRVAERTTWIQSTSMGPLFVQMGGTTLIIAFC